jgi:hypothetical protein
MAGKWLLERSCAVEAILCSGLILGNLGRRAKRLTEAAIQPDDLLGGTVNIPRQSRELYGWWPLKEA